jgi:competence protein ComGC
VHYRDVFEAAFADLRQYAAALVLRRKKQMKHLRRFWPKRQRAFTLIEMVIVVAIIATLVLLISPNLLAQKDRADKRTNDAFNTTIRTQVELYEENTGKTPVSFQEMVNAHYLTQKQGEQAEDKKLAIGDFAKSGE